MFIVVAGIGGTDTVAPAATLHLLLDWCFRLNSFVTAIPLAVCVFACVCVYSIYRNSIVTHFNELPIQVRHLLLVIFNTCQRKAQTRTNKEDKNIYKLFFILFHFSSHSWQSFHIPFINIANQHCQITQLDFVRRFHSHFD